MKVRKKGREGEREGGRKEGGREKGGKKEGKKEEDDKHVYSLMASGGGGKCVLWF